MRLIDADALYERACELEAQALAYVGKIANDETKIEEWRIWSAILAERTAFKHDIFDAPEVKTEPHWIPCEERLPTEDGDYFVTVDSRYIPPNCRNTDKFIWHDGKWVIIDCLALDSDGWNKQYKIIEVDIPVLAWMPLPEGYVEGEG